MWRGYKPLQLSLSREHANGEADAVSVFASAAADAVGSSVNDIL